MVDLEFTVQKGELFILQSRVGKRSARAAFQIAVDLVSEKVIDQKTALGRLTADQFKVMRRPMIDPSFKEKPHLVGLPACPGVVTGRPVFSSEEAVKAKDPVILVTHETDPDDIAGMAKAVGILTQTGGATSHAAVVARAMDKPCVVGCSQMELMDGMIGITGKLTNADVTIDGSTGRVWVGVKVPVIDASEDPAIQTVMGWCMSDLGACETVAGRPRDGQAAPHHRRALVGQRVGARRHPRRSRRAAEPRAYRSRPAAPEHVRSGDRTRRCSTHSASTASMTSSRTRCASSWCSGRQSCRVWRWPTRL